MLIELTDTTNSIYRRLPPEYHEHLVKFYRSLPDADPILDFGDTGSHGVQLQTHGRFHKHLKVLGRRLQPADFTRKKTPASAMVRVQVGEEKYYGEVTAVFTHKQGDDRSQDFACMHWMRASLYNFPRTEGVWNNFR